MDNSLNDLFSTSGIFDDFNMDSNFNHLQIIFKEVLYTVSYIDVEKTIFNEEIPKLKQACDETIYNITALLQSDQTNVIEEVKCLIQRYNTLINFANEAVKYINKRVEFIQVQSLPLAICEILFNAFKHCKDSDRIYGNNFVSISSLLTNLFKSTNELQNSILKLMNNFIIFNLSDEHENHVLMKVIGILSNIGEIVSSLDIKTAAELWKGYLILSQTHIEHIKRTVNIEHPLKHLCKEVIESLKQFENTSDLKNVEKFLKITSFHLKIIIKLCGLYDYLGDAYRDLFNLLITLNRYSIPFLHYHKFNTKLIDLMQVYVIVASEPLLSCLISRREFVQYFFQNTKPEFENNNNRLAAILLTVSIVKKILIDDAELQQLWISDDNILIIIFETIELLHVELSIDLEISISTHPGEPNKICSLYEYLLTYTVSMIINMSQQNYKFIQKLLFESIMQLNIWKALFSTDVWCILARHGSEDTCFQQITFLINVLLSLKNHTRCEVQFLTNLISRLFQLLTNKYKNKIIQMYPLNEYQQLSNIIGKNNNENRNIDNIVSFLKDINKNNFLKMVKSLQLVPTNDAILIKLTENVTNLWSSINVNHFHVQQYFWQFQFIWNLSKTTRTLMAYFNNKDLLNVLQCVIAINIPLVNCMILKSLATKSLAPSPDQMTVFTKVAQIFQIVLKNRHPIVRQIAFETFTYFAQHTIHEHILGHVVDEEINLREEISKFLQKIKPSPTMSSIEYFQRQNNDVKFQHKCIQMECSQPVTKKMKITAQFNIDATLERMKFDIDSLNQKFKHERIPDNYKHDLSYIVLKLQELLQS